MQTGKTVAAAFAGVLAAVAALPLEAEVFSSTYETVQAHDNYDQITDMLIGSGVARRPNGLRIDGTRDFQVGVYSNLVAQAALDFTNGVVISTGLISDGPSLTNTLAKKKWSDEGVSLSPRDESDLAGYFSGLLGASRHFYDTAGIILYVQPTNKTINIPFLMASEEFFYGASNTNTPTLAKYSSNSDKFAFFLKELGPASEVLDSTGAVKSEYHDVGMATNETGNAWWNIAKLREGGDIEISSVNQHTNSTYFIKNVSPDEDGHLNFPAGDIALPMEFNGAIVGPEAVAYGLDPAKVYKLKIVIADFGDNTVNSAVFLRARGITSGADLAVALDGPSYLASHGSASYTCTVSNIGPATADGVSVKYYIPEGVVPSTVVPVCDTGSVDPAGWGVENGTNYFVWVVGDGFAHGSTASMTVECTLPEGGVYTSVAEVDTTVLRKI